MKCDVCGTEYARTGGPDPVADATKPMVNVMPGSNDPTFPRLVYNHLFQSPEELFDYERRVAERDANLSGNLDAQQQAELQPGAQDVRAMSVGDLEWVMANINAVLSNHGATHGPMKALHELSNLMTAGGIHDDGTGHIVPPSSFPQLAALTTQRVKELAGLA